MMTSALVFGLFGCLTGSSALVLQWFAYRRERSRLIVGVELSIQSSIKIPAEHFRLRITLINSGYRPVSVIDGRIDLVPRIAVFNGQLVPVKSASIQIFGREKQLGVITVPPQERREITVEPFDARHLRDSKGNAKAVFTDAIGREYRTTFDIPFGVEINTITEGFDRWLKEQKDKTDTGTHQ